MSLIDEALKRARDEAARQEEEHRRGKRPWVPPPPPRPRRSGPAVAAFAAGIVFVAAGAWLFVRRSPAPPSAANPESSQRETPTPAPRAAATSASPVPASTLPPVAESVEVPPPAAPKSRAEEPPPSHEPRSPAASAPAPAVPAAPPAPPPTESRAALRDGKSFVRVVEVPGGERIELDGIVYSETNPVAVIGGKLLAPGAYIGDFQVVRIEEDRVTLRGRGVTIYVTPG